MADDLGQERKYWRKLGRFLAMQDIFRQRGRCVFFQVLLVGFLPVIAGAQVKKPPIDSCEQREMMRLTYKGDLVKALAKSEACVAYYEKEAGPDGDVISSSIASGGPSNWFIGYYMCAKIQLLTMMNATSDAERALSELESFADYNHPLFDNWMFADGWNELLNLTRGMVLEKEGKIEQARHAYRECTPLEVNWPACSGRLALLALHEKDDGQAEGWARSGAVFGDPTALSVLGALAEAAGIGWEARLAYSDAQLKMEQLQADESHDFKPALMSERHRVQEGLLRVLKPNAARVVETAGKRRFYDADKKVVGWDRWPHILYSADVKNEQDEYNTWLESFRPAPNGVALRPQYPRFFVGFSPDERSKLAAQGVAIPTGGGFGIPTRIEPTGVLDLDTLAIPFFKGVVDVSELAKAIGLRLDELQVLNESGTTTGHEAKQAAEILELYRAVDELKQLHSLLEKITLTTAAGVTFNATDEARRYAEFSKIVKKTIDFDYPPDFVTAHLDRQQLTPEFIESLGARQRALRTHIRAARKMINP
jgi:hypothetical protein